MLQALIRALSRIVNVFWTLIITALLSGATAAMWHFYQEAHRQAQFQNEGRPITLRIEHTDRNPRNIWDNLSSFVYVGFSYHNHPYEIRYTGSTTWLSAGNEVDLLYNARLDAFSQPAPATTKSTHVVSRLVGWTIFRNIKAENKLLAGLILSVLALFFVAGGGVVTLTGWTFIRTIAEFLFIAALGACALFFTYDAVQYYQYSARLRAGGRPANVIVVNTDRHTLFRQQRFWYKWYAYEATFRFNGQERIIPINESDYDRLKTGDTHLVVLHNTDMDDFIATDYSLSFMPLAGALCFWFIFIVIARPALTRPATS